MLTQLEEVVIASIQDDIPLIKRPYKELAKQAGISEEAFLETLKAINNKGIIRRFGMTLRHQKSGFKANAMVAWKVAENCIQEVGSKMATFKEVSHCYRRNPSCDWQYNLYTMIHTKDEESCYKIVKKMSDATSVETYELLFSKHELKKTSMQYF